MLSKSAKRLLLSVALIGATASSSFAAVNFNVDIGVAPPPVRYEAVPVARPGYAWAPGHWEWDGGRHVWVGGSWIEERPGYRYVPAKWVHHGHRWGYTQASWVSDPRWDHNRDWRHDNHDHDHDWHR